MTDNHLLLYRLAELMLEQERHILPVDDLFDDDRIGDYVKSIQIDSPYQQMIFEGVLTESVRDEKLFVSFTVEGYFHYVLGEVILGISQRLGIEKMLDSFNKKSFSHLDYGLSQYLVNEVNRGNHKLIIRFLDSGFEKTNLLAPAVVQILLIHPDFKELFKYEDEFLWTSVIKKIILISKYALLENCTSQLDKSFSKKLVTVESIPHMSNEYLFSITDDLDNPQLKLSLLFYTGRYQDVITMYENHKSDIQLSGSSLFVLASAMIDMGNFKKALDLLGQEIMFNENIIDKYRLESIAFNGIEMNEKALESIGFAIMKSREFNGAYHLKTAELLNLEGLYMLVNGEFQKSIDSFDNSSDIIGRVKGENNFEFATAVNNRGLVHYHAGNLREAIKNWSFAISILENCGMGRHPESATIHKNLAFCHEKLDDVSNAKNHIKISHQILVENGLFESESALECIDFLNKLEKDDQ